VDVLLLEPDQEERSPILVGFHQHARGRRTLNASEFLAVLPPASPSRAYLKIEQAIAWGRLPLRAEDRAIELGSAPGGASFALLLRGLEVWGIDPGAMDPVVWSDPRCENRFHHVKKAFSGVLRGDLPAQAQWLALDINGPARVSLPYVETLAGWFSESLLGVILTLKVNDPKNAKHLPEWLERVETLGFRQVRAAQLPSHKREVCIVGLSKKGLLRGSSTH
jgi:23S rRNA (cytidine2498-2'-O)-methyltransferase